tara:strand:- start:2352 stop:3530 length:1179 start_codon:yes stop_codon:yes gene_type:complete
MVILKDKNGTKFVESRTVSKNDALKLTMEIGHQPGVESSLITDSEDRAMTADESRLQKLIGDKLGMYGTRDGSKDFQVDDATVDSHKEVIFTGGTVQFATSGEMESVEFDNSTGDVDWTLTKPIRMGKWEYWNLDIAAALQTSLNRGEILPDDCGKDNALFYGFGRNSSPINLTKTGLERNAGVFNHSTCVDKDEDLITESNRILVKYDIKDKLRTCVNVGLEPPTTESADWDAVNDKKYDIIIAATPPYDKKEGCYWVKSQIRGAEEGIEAAKDLTNTPEIPFNTKTEQYTAIAKFEDRCYDDNWNELNTIWRNAKSFLKPGGYILTVHNCYASDIDTFKPMLEKYGITLVEDGLLTRQAHEWPLARHWFMRQTLVGPLYPSNKYYMLCKI